MGKNNSKSKNKKKYNPKRFTFDRFESAFGRTMTLADQRRLGVVQQIRLFATLGDALIEVQEVFSPPAFNQLAHGYRIACCIAGKEGMDMPEFHKMCEAAHRTLDTYLSDFDAEPMPEDLAAPLALMLDALKAVCDHVPLNLFERAVEVSKTMLFDGMYQQFERTEEWKRQAALMFMDGALGENVAAKLGKPVPEVTAAVRGVAAIVHAIHDDMTVDFPSSMGKLRKVGPALKPTLQALMATYKVMEKMDAAQAERDADTMQEAA